MIRRIALSIAALALGAGIAFADDGHDDGPKHGGVVEHSGHHHVELVAKGGAIELYVTNEDGAEEDSSAAKASATVLADGKTEMVTLAPAGGNSFKGTGGFNAGAGTTIVVSLTMPGHSPEQVRFKLD